jgi:putative acetyltransferase
VRAVVAAAFADEPVVADLEADLDALPTSVGYVALADDDEVVGHVRLTWCWLDTEPRLVDVLVLSPLSVSPSWQRRGIGRRLVEHAIAEADTLGAPLLLLEGDPTYYARIGFVPAIDIGVTRPSVRIPTAAMQAVPLSSREDWMRGALVYADTFWRHDAVGLRGETLLRVREALGD